MDFFRCSLRGLFPSPPFAVVNMVAGACQIRLRDFSLATALGMIPGIAIIVVLEDQLGRTLRDPTIGIVALLTGLAIVFGGLGVMFYRWYTDRLRRSA
jgi:phospholipase D1/2